MEPTSRRSARKLQLDDDGYDSFNHVSKLILAKVLILENSKSCEEPELTTSVTNYQNCIVF